jgi:hypothetical protein
MMVFSVNFGYVGLLVVESDYLPELISQVFTAIALNTELDAQLQAVYKELKAYFVRFDSHLEMHTTGGGGEVIKQYLAYMRGENDDCYPVSMELLPYIKPITGREILVRMKGE